MSTLAQAILPPGSWADRPTNHSLLTEGRLYFAVDKNAVYRDSGSDWVSVNLVDVPFAFEWRYDNEAARLAATGFTSGDLYKLAFQVSDLTFWLLTAATPTWLQFGERIPEGRYLRTVSRNSTLSGDGTPANPLAVVPDPATYLEEVTHDESLTGDGTPEHPLSVAEAGGHTIKSASETLPQRSNLKIVGATLTDDAPGDATVVTIVAGEGGGSVGDVYVAESDYILVRDEKPMGTHGGSSVANAWTKRTLNTKVSDVGGHCSLASDQITLVPGTYVCNISSPARQAGAFQIRLYNVTTSTVVALGTSQTVPVGSNFDANGISTLQYKFTLAASSVLEVQYYLKSAYATAGLGVASSIGVEVYTVAEFWRLTESAPMPDVYVAESDYILVRDEKPSGTSGGDFVSGAWRTRDINVKVSDAGEHCSIAANRITLAPGTYYASILCPAFGVSQNQARLYNITDALTVAYSTSGMQSGPNTNSFCFIRAKFTLLVPTVFEVQHRSAATSSFGIPANFGNPEIYTIAEFWRSKEPLEMLPGEQAGLGAWETKAHTTIYHAETDGFVTAHVLDGTFSILTDSANPPTTVRVFTAGTAAPGNRRCSATCPVKKGDYYQIVNNSGSAPIDIFWIPLEAPAPLQIVQTSVSPSALPDELLFDTTLSADGTIDTNGTDLSGFTDLFCLLEARGVRSDFQDYFCVYFNGDSVNANYASVSGGSVPEAGLFPAATAPANSFGFAEWRIPDYENAVHTKTLNCTTGGLTGSNSVTRKSDTMCWKSVAAITRIQVKGQVVANFLAGTRMRVYGIGRKA